MDAVQERVNYVNYVMKDREASFSINDKKVDLNCFKDRSLSIKDLNSCRCNTKGYLGMIKKLDNESLDGLVRNVVSNITTIGDGCLTYEEILVNAIVPELLNRILDKVNGGE